MDHIDHIDPNARIPNHSSFRERFKKIPWVDIALVVGIVALATIGLLTHFGIINPAFKLPHVGTISAKFIENSLYGAAGAFTLIEIIYRFCKYMRSKQAIVPPIILSEEPNTPIPGVPSILLSGATSISAETKLTVHNKEATLYGIYPSETMEVIQKECEEKFQECSDNNNSYKEALDKLSYKHKCPLAFKIDDSLIYASKNALLLHKIENKITITFEQHKQTSDFKEKKNQECHILILGNDETMAAFIKSNEAPETDFENFQATL